MKHTTMAIAAVIGLIVTSSASAEAAAKGDPAKAQQKVTEVCAACHNADGNSASPANPKLAGQPAEYITKQLTNFKSGERKSAVMSGMVATLTADDMKNLGAYFSGKAVKPGTAKDKALANLGQKLFRGGNQSSGVPACAACHGPSGAGIPAQFPRLGSQHAEYIVAQLKNFRSGERANDGGKMMRTIATKMTDQEMSAVAEYINGLH